MPAGYRIQIQSSNMYYPYGSAQPGRCSQTAVTYRYGFQGQQKDNEIRGEGNSLNYKYRMHDARIGRFFVLDLFAPEYPHNSPYAFSENRVIDAVELEGLESVVFHHVTNVNTGQTQIFVNTSNQSAMGLATYDNPESQLNPQDVASSNQFLRVNSFVGGNAPINSSYQVLPNSQISSNENAALANHNINSTTKNNSPNTNLPNSHLTIIDRPGIPEIETKDEVVLSNFRQSSFQLPPNAIQVIQGNFVGTSLNQNQIANVNIPLNTGQWSQPGQAGQLNFTINFNDGGRFQNSFIILDANNQPVSPTGQSGSGSLPIGTYSYDLNPNSIYTIQIGGQRANDADDVYGVVVSPNN